MKRKPRRMWAYERRELHETQMAGVAACVLEAMDNKEAAEALGLTPDVVQARLLRLCVRYQAPNRVGLALALQREVMGWQ